MANVVITSAGAQDLQGTDDRDIVLGTGSDPSLRGGAGDDILRLAADGSVVRTVTLETLNGSGVTGTAVLTEGGDTLAVDVAADGLEAGQVHPLHIHGAFDADGNPVDSTVPTADLDTDGDGFLELAEGLPAYGPVLLPLTAPPGDDAAGFPTAPEDGTITFHETYDLTDPATFAEGFSAEDLDPLHRREIVFHGLTVDGGAGVGTAGEVDGTAGYKAALPVAAGEIVFDSVLGADAEDGGMDGGGTGNATDGIGTTTTALFGDDGDDLLVGDDDANTFDGGAGDDRMIGNDGADLFHFGDGHDRIEDLDVDEGDLVQLAEGLTAADALDNVSAGEDGAVVDFGDGTTLTLVGLDVGDVGADLFASVVA